MLSLTVHLTITDGFDQPYLCHFHPTQPKKFLKQANLKRNSMKPIIHPLMHLLQKLFEFLFVHPKTIIRRLRNLNANIKNLLTNRDEL